MSSDWRKEKYLQDEGFKMFKRLVKKARTKKTYVQAVTSMDKECRKGKKYVNFWEKVAENYLHQVYQVIIDNHDGIVPEPLVDMYRENKHYGLELLMLIRSHRD